MTIKTITGGTYKLGRLWKDGSRPHHGRQHCQGDAKLTNTVNSSDSSGQTIAHPCPWHKPSRHHMRSWPRVIRFEKYGLVERICSHGVGHPDPDSLAFIGEYIAAGPHESLAIHGCDGCCGEAA